LQGFSTCFEETDWPGGTVKQDVSAFFVYGTLKQAQLRGSMWPRPPKQIRKAIVQANLFDLGPYPAAHHGSNWLMGEAWLFESADMPVTIEVLDRIEGFEALGKNNEYLRETISVHCGDGDPEQELMAYIYLIASPKRLEIARLIPPFLHFLDRQVACWPDPHSRVPANFAEE